MAFRRSSAHSLFGFVLILLGLTTVSAAFAESGAPSASASNAEASASLSPVDDPWLSEEGPAIPAPVEVPDDRVMSSWRAAGTSPDARAAALHRTRLEFGIWDLKSQAAAIATAQTNEDPEVQSAMAKGLAPRVPAFRVGHGLTLARSGDIGGAILELGAAAWVTVTHLPSQLWMLENFSFIFLIVVLVASLFFMLLAAIQVFPHAAHDFGDLLSPKMPNFARYAALSALLLTPIVFGEGLAGLTVILFALAFIYGASRQRSALVMAAIFLMIGLQPLSQIASVTTGLVDQDPMSKSVLAVLSGTESAADVELLDRLTENEVVAAHALAYRARRLGLEDESIERLDDVIARYPADVVALANRGNVENRRGQTEAAIGFYERAAAQAGSSTLLFNLSQSYARVFRMEEYEATLSRAQMLGDDSVAELSSLGDAKLVADLGYPVSMLRERLVARGLDATASKAMILEVFAPGRLGEGWHVLAAVFGLIALVSLLAAGSWEHASVCTRCGHRICTRCEETTWSDELCEDCHHLFQNPEATDPSLRVARLQALSERESRIDRFVLALSLLVPGAAGMAARRPDLSLVALLLFCWLTSWIVWPSGVFSDPMLMGNAAVIAFAIPGVLALLGYVSFVFFSLIVRKSR